VHNFTINFSVVISDCPRQTVISPPTACQAGTTLTCSSSSYPAASYIWIDNLSGNVIKRDSTYKLPVGQFDLTCEASINVECTNGYYAPVVFPNSVLNRTSTNHTIQCFDSATIAGLSISTLIVLIQMPLFLSFAYSYA